MPWTRFPARLAIPRLTRRLPKARASMRCPRLLTTRPWPLTKKKIRERIDYVVRGLDANGAGSTLLGASLTTAQAHRTAAKQHPRRIAIVSLASTEHPHFVPSLAEAGEDFSGTQLHYSVDTVRYFRHVYHGDRLFFMIGADAFLDIPMWKEYETLLMLCDFIIANRPGIRTEALRLVIPPDLMARADEKKEADPPSQVVAQLHKTSVYLLENVSSEVSATDVRRRQQRGQSIHGLVSARVEEYILKQGLYK